MSPGSLDIIDTHTCSQVFTLSDLGVVDSVSVCNNDSLLAVGVSSHRVSQFNDRIQPVIAMLVAKDDNSWERIVLPVLPEHGGNQVLICMKNDNHFSKKVFSKSGVQFTHIECHKVISLSLSFCLHRYLMFVWFLSMVTLKVRWLYYAPLPPASLFTPFTPPHLHPSSRPLERGELRVSHAVTSTSTLLLVVQVLMAIRFVCGM